MVFHILNFSQCVCFGIKRSTKLQISKPTHLFYFFIQELQQTARLDYKIMFLYLWYHKDNPAYENLNGWRVGRMLGWAQYVSKSKLSVGYITIFLMETNCFQKMLNVIFI